MLIKNVLQDAHPADAINDLDGLQERLIAKGVYPGAPWPGYISSAKPLNPRTFNSTFLPQVSPPAGNMCAKY